MEYINDADYSFIMNKYHKADEPFDCFHRFVVREDIFDESTGLHPSEIKRLISENDAGVIGSHSLKKAAAVDFVLKNTRILCDPHDRFPGIQCLDRPINKTLVNVWKNEAISAFLSETEAERDFLERTGACTIWPDYDHSVPVWEDLMSLGFCGIRDRVKAAEEAFFSEREESCEKRDFFAAMAQSFDSLSGFTGRLASLAEKTEGCERMATALRAIEKFPPKSYYEALLLCYMYFIVSEHICGLQVRSLGHFDRLFFPFVARDLENGVSEDEIRTDTAYFFLQFTAIGNYWCQPVWFGGESPCGTSSVNRLSYIALDVYDRMGIFNPKLQIKLSDGTPDDFIEKALDMIRRGHNSIAFVNDGTVRKALGRLGISETDAANADIKGCYEYALPGEYDTSMNYINLVKPLEYTLFGGKDLLTGEPAGLPSPKDFPAFSDLLSEYKRQLGALLDRTVKIVNGYEDYLDYINPQPMLSATFPHALKTGCDALAGGAYPALTEALLGGIATVSDSLRMIEKYVYEKKELTTDKLRSILRENFENDGLLRLRLLADREKFGNNKEGPDRIAKEILDFVTERLVMRPNAKRRGGVWTVGTHVARMSYIFAEKTTATPDGRRIGEEFSKNLSATIGQNREGATAAILSAVKFDHSLLKGDACVDVGLLPSSVKGKDGLEAMKRLISVYFEMGGHAVHFNVFDAETLKNAQKHPEQYRDLQIRVSGWNVLFGDISPKEQDGFIRQAESLI